MTRAAPANEYRITDDRDAVDLDFVERMLRASYWAADRSRERIEQSVAASLCFTALRGEEQVGFARVVTDSVTFAWIADVVVDPRHRGRGLGRRLVESILAHPQVVRCTRLHLRTEDAHGLYERFGFERAECMVRPAPE